MLDKFLVKHDAVLFMPFNEKCDNHSEEENYTNNSSFIIQSLSTAEDVLDCIVKASSYSHLLNNHMPSSKRKCLSKEISNLQISSYDAGQSTKSKKNAVENRQALKVYMDGYLLSVFVNVLKLSMFYRVSVIHNFKRVKQLKENICTSLRVIIKLKYPSQDIIDYAWNRRMERLAIERRELDNAMSWLSTLGGAFSALGDEFEYCAEMAGRISLQQMDIALRLGDPLTVARCKLYLALSLMQRGHLRRARHMVEEQYRLAHANPIIDTRLVRMCQGIWAKLRYLHHMRRESKRGKCIINRQ